MTSPVPRARCFAACSGARTPTAGATTGCRADRLPRRIRYWSDDLHLLLGFVKSGAALAYLPDFALADPGLVRIDVKGDSFACGEQVWLVWNRATASEWQRQLAKALGGG